MNFVEVTELGAGMSFGEISLIDNKPRSATIMCKSICDFAVLDKVNYVRILSNFFNL